MPRNGANKADDDDEDDRKKIATFRGRGKEDTTGRVEKTVKGRPGTDRETHGAVFGGQRNK